MSNEHWNPDPVAVAARQVRDQLRLQHEAATAELTACRARLRGAEAKRASDATAYEASLHAAHAQRDRVVTLVEQIRVAEAHLTLAEAAAPSSRDDRPPTTSQRHLTTAPTGGAR